MVWMIVLHSILESQIDLGHVHVYDVLLFVVVKNCPCLYKICLVSINNVYVLNVYININSGTDCLVSLVFLRVESINFLLEDLSLSLLDFCFTLILVEDERLNKNF